MPAPSVIRNLVLVLGDQLSLDNPALQNFDPAQDRVLMIEAQGEGAQVWSHKARIALFLSAMRHFAQTLSERDWPCTYVRLEEGIESGLLLFSELLAQQIRRLKPDLIQICEPGEWRMLATLQDTAQACGVPLQVHADTHFMCSREEFAAWAGSKKELRMEFFYRHMRQRHNLLVQGKEPLGGQWNFDAENRKGFGKAGPGPIAPPAQFAPDAITTEVLALVQKHFSGHPGSLAHFGWPVTRTQALEALQRFVQTRLAHFGAHQDAMWSGMPFGWHALLSTSLNLHLLHPREVIDAALAAREEHGLELASVEGFVRQVLGWREFVRGMYWLDMPRMKDANHYQHQRALPQWYWNADTQMNCMRQCVGQTLEYGYAHHIQRLMVTGQFALLAQVAPQAVCDWYLAMYVDAVEWVELPNTAGMALFALGPRFTSKPYIASGQYIKRMSNYCTGCRYQPEQRVGANACPVTTLYWNFLDQHEAALARNPRTALMVKNITRLSEPERQALRAQAQETLAQLDRL